MSEEVTVMWSEVLTTIGLFGLFFIVIPVAVFTTDIIKDYRRKEAKRRDNR